MTRIADDVGAIIPVYNRPRLVLKTLDSVAQQTVLPGKLIVIDDGSTDGTAEAVRRWIDNLQIPLNAHLISTERRNAAAARNRGIQALGQCKYVAMLDSDDLWPENFIERMTKRLNKETEAIAVTCDRMFLNLRTSAKKYHDFTQIKYDPVAFIIMNGGGFLSCSMLRRKPMLEAGGFCETLPIGEDSDLLLRIALMGPWLHEPGEPAIMTKHNHIVDEEGHLSKKYADAHIRWASNYDSFMRGVGADHPNRNKWKHLVSIRWYNIGHRLYKKKLYADAHIYFGKAVYWKRTRLKNLYKYLINLIMRIMA